jgi:hypothetical protein
MRCFCKHCTFSYSEHRKVLDNMCCPDGGNVFAKKHVVVRNKSAREAVQQIRAERAAKKLVGV